MIDTRPFFPVPGFDIENPQWLFSRSDVEQSIRPPPACRDDCHVCTATYYTVQDQEKPQFSYRSRLSNREAEQVCQVLVGQIHDHRTYITQILEKHADDLVARWSKKGRFGSQSKRDELLKVVAPDLSTSHRCIVSVVYSEDGERQYICSRSLATRRKLLLPWLNREILKTHPDALFALLYYRTAYGPQDWANFDATNIKEHFVQGSYDVDWAEKPIDIRVSIFSIPTKAHESPQVLSFFPKTYSKKNITTQVLFTICWLYSNNSSNFMFQFMLTLPSYFAIPTHLPLHLTSIYYLSSI